MYYANTRRKGVYRAKRTANHKLFNALAAANVSMFALLFIVLMFHVDVFTRVLYQSTSIGESLTVIAAYMCYTAACIGSCIYGCAKVHSFIKERF